MFFIILLLFGIFIALLKMETRFCTMEKQYEADYRYYQTL
jgi:hypothetical protein